MKKRKNIFIISSRINKTRIIFVIILSIAIVTSLIFVFQKKKGGNDFITIQKTSDENAQFNFSPETQSFLDNLKNKTETDNFTQNVITKYGMQIASQNPDGPRGSEVLIPSDKTLADTIQNELQKTISINSIKFEDLKTREPENQESITSYLGEIGIIVNDINAQSMRLSLTTNNFTETDIKKMGVYGDALENASLRLFAISVPPSWKSIHVDLVNLYRKKAILFQIIGKTNEDPVKAIVAMHELQNLSTQEISLAENFEEKIENVKL